MQHEDKTPGVSAGDRLVVHAHHLGGVERDAEILEVLRDGGAYRVRWQDDGHVSIVYPSSDVRVEHFPSPARRRGAGDGP